MFIKPEHIQGSPEWLAHRKKHIGASDAPIILGTSPWSTPLKLWQEKLGLSEGPAENFAMRRGSEMEPVARRAFEIEHDIEVFPKVVYHDTEAFMMASLDGVSLDGKLAVEIKCPGAKAHAEALSGKVPEHYNAQLQHQLACLGLNKIWYYSFDGENGVSIEVQRDEKFIKKMIIEERKFWNCVVTHTAPALSNRDYSDCEDPRGVDLFHRIEELVEERRSHQEEVDSIDSEITSLKEELVAIAGDNSLKFNNITLGRSFPAGRVNYSSIPELKDVDLNKYRSDPKERWTLRVK